MNPILLNCTVLSCSDLVLRKINIIEVNNHNLLKVLVQYQAIIVSWQQFLASLSSTVAFSYGAAVIGKNVKKFI